MASKNGNDLIDEYVEMFNEPFPIFEAVQEEVELIRRIKECIAKKTSYELLYPINYKGGILY